MEEDIRIIGESKLLCCDGSLGSDQVYIPDLMIHRVHIKHLVMVYRQGTLFITQPAKIACINKLGSCIAVTEKPIPFKYAVVGPEGLPMEIRIGGSKSGRSVICNCDHIIGFRGLVH